MRLEDLPTVNRLLANHFANVKAPLMDLVAIQTRDPFKVLVGTILSARTKDASTAAACQRLFARAATPAALSELALEELEQLIYPVGFYRVKARQLQALPGVLQAKFEGVIPQTVEELCELPGVGRKTANLVVSLAFNKPAICVDVHVHRITNRWGLVKTANPEQTEMALRSLLPQRYWINWNSYVVAFGQTLCAPRNPPCAGCFLRSYCAHGQATLTATAHT